MFVKICGLVSERDVEVCTAFKADALGFVVETPGSKRNIPLDRARELVALARKRAKTVLVISRERRTPVYELAGSIGPHLVQLHFDAGDEDIAQAHASGAGVIGVVSAGGSGLEDVAEVEIITKARKLAPKVDYLLIDARGPTGLGGSGKRVDTGRAARLVASLVGTKVLLSGGLDPANVGAALAKIKPFGVDVSTGVEGSAGKDPDRVRKFIGAARSE